jgi:hypothetical protein
MTKDGTSEITKYGNGPLVDDRVSGCDSGLSDSGSAFITKLFINNEHYLFSDQ